MNLEHRISKIEEAAKDAEKPKGLNFDINFDDMDAALARFLAKGIE